MFCCTTPIGNCNSCGPTGACTGCDGGYQLSLDKSECVRFDTSSPDTSTPNSSPDKQEFSAYSFLVYVLGPIGAAVLVGIATCCGFMFDWCGRCRAFLCCFCRRLYDHELGKAKRCWPLAAALYSELLLPEPGLRESNPVRCGFCVASLGDFGPLLMEFESKYRQAAHLTLEECSSSFYADTAKENAKRAKSLFEKNPASSIYANYRFPKTPLFGLCGRNTKALWDLIGKRTKPAIAFSTLPRSSCRLLLLLLFALSR